MRRRALFNYAITIAYALILAGIAFSQCPCGCQARQQSYQSSYFYSGPQVNESYYSYDRQYVLVPQYSGPQVNQQFYVQEPAFRPRFTGRQRFQGDFSFGFSGSRGGCANGRCR